MGVFHAKGWWLKSSLPSLESLSSLGFEERNLGCSGNFARMSRTPGGVQIVCAKKVRAYFSLPSKVEISEQGKKLLEMSMSYAWFRVFLFGRGYSLAQT